MNYIVFDLEWNQSPYGKHRENPRIPFEIIEIGAVKLNERKKEIGRFHETIKPLVYRTMNKRTQDVVHIKMDELAKSRTFSPVARSFLEWCGSDFIFVTWGTLDVFELQRNMSYYKIQYSFPFPLLYYDLQKLYSLLYLDGKKRPALEDAVDALGLEKPRAFHRALDDTLYTAAIMQHMNLKSVLPYKSVDYFRLPQDKSEEIFLDFKTYSKYVSMPYASRDAALADKTVTALKCNRCGLPVWRRVKWFAPGSGSTYYGLVQCPRHGHVKGKIRIKKLADDQVFVVKTIKPATPEDVASIKEKKEAIRIKRKERRRNKKKKTSSSESNE